MNPPVCLLVGRTAHTREKPFKRSFSHAIAMIEIDINRLEEAGRASRLFAINKSAPLAFHETDYGARDPKVPLRLWAEGRFAAGGVRLNGGAIRLVTFPRVLGYGFAPISLWFGFTPDGALRGVIYEVHNTFGETHAYVSAFDPDLRPVAPKQFFVSPFFEIDGSYRFTLRPTAERIDLIVENIAADGRTHVASLVVRKQQLTGAAILKWLATMPISGLGVMLAIHWQALILLLKGAAYIQKPAQRAERTTLAGTATQTNPADRPKTDRPRKRA